MIVSVLQRWFSERAFDQVCEQKAKPEQFEIDLNRLITEFATQAYHLPQDERTNIQSVEEYIQIVTRRDHHISNTQRNLSKGYSLLHDSYKDWMITRDQENWANSQDHRKALIYRIASAIAFAGLLLAVGFLADQWGIPLPLLRLI